MKKFQAPRWPTYSLQCRRDMAAMLRRGGALSAYRANPDHGTGPAIGSWAWDLEWDVRMKFRMNGAVAVNSGTAALIAALKAIDVRDKEVITTPYTFSATVSAILLAGGIPVFADVDPDSFVITAETVKPLITRRTGAILPVHLFGYFQDMNALLDLGIPIVEDACQAVGASRWLTQGGKKRRVYAGTVGKAGCYSFQGGKQIPAGEGGMVVSDDPYLARYMRFFVNHGENFDQPFVGENYRPPETTCLLAWHALQEMEKRQAVRERLAERVGRALRGLIIPQKHDAPHCNAFYAYAFTQSRLHNVRLKEELAERKIPCGAGYITPPLHHYRAFQRYCKRMLPVVDDLSFRRLNILSVLQPGLTEESLNLLINAFREILG